MASIQSISFIFTVAVGIFAYIFYTPLPEDAVEPWKQLLARSIIRIPFSGANFVEKFGFNNVNFMRFWMDGNKDYIAPDRELDIFNAKFDGIEVRVYKPKTAIDNGPGLIYIHGGATNDVLVRRIAKWSNYFVIAFGYRRAPEHVYPAAFDDCYKATRYFISNAKDYNVDPAQIAISGDSAGGNLAAAVSLKIGKDGDPRFKLTSQTLIYPALQALDLDLPAYRVYNDDGGPFFLAKPLMTKFWLWYGEGNLNYFSEFSDNKQLTSDIKLSKYYRYIDRKILPEKYQLQDKSPSLKEGNKQLFNNVSKWLLDPYFAPLMASDDDLRNLPPTHVITAEYDPLRDDGFFFANRLQALNKTLVHSHYDGVFHAFMSYDFLDVSGRALNDMVKFWYFTAV